MLTDKYPKNSIEIISTLRRTKLFLGVDEKVIADIVGNGIGYIKKYKKNEIIIRSGEKLDAFSVILKGQVIIKRNLQDGSETVDNVLKEKKTIGIEFAENQNYVSLFDYIAYTDVEIYSINQKYFTERLLPGGGDTSSRILRNMLGLMVCENHRQSRKLYILSMGSIRRRLLAFLGYEYEKSGSDEFQIAFSRENLAAYLYVNRSALSREIGQMVRDGLIISKGRYFKILDPQMLENYIM